MTIQSSDLANRKSCKNSSITNAMKPLKRL